MEKSVIKINLQMLDELATRTTVDHEYVSGRELFSFLIPIFQTDMVFVYTDGNKITDPQI